MSAHGVRAVLCIVGLLCLLLPPGRDGGGPVVRAEQSDRDVAADKASCLEKVGSWSEAQLRELSSLPPESALDRVKLRDLLFFLHIPRTGGRTFDQCFLKHLFASDQRCPRSYDKLRIDRNQPGCRLISTHDDYSLLDNLPHGVTSVITSLREPVDRVLSSYEFSTEVAARSLRRAAARKPIPKRSAGPVKGGNKFMNTLDIWPWRYLVPTMEKDLFWRRDARRAAQMNGTGLSVDDTYDAAVLAMPFAEFVDHPVAHELVHNGATFQVAGLTNTSFSENAGAIRHCVDRFPHLGQLVVDVAKKRLDRMLYVGLTERQNESAVFFAKVLGDQISMEVFMKSVLSQGKSSRAKTASPSPPKLQFNFTSLDEFTEEEVMGAMMESYRLCVADLRRAQEDRRSRSLDFIKPIKFSRERRKLIPDSVMQKVSELNSLDAELYAHAQVLFQRQQKLLEFGSFHFMKDAKMWSEDSHPTQDGLKDNYELLFSFKVGPELLVCVLVLAFFVTVCSIVRSRRGARVKET